jgi:hypothetical protein
LSFAAAEKFPFLAIKVTLFKISCEAGHLPKVFSSRGFVTHDRRVGRFSTVSCKNGVLFSPPQIPTGLGSLPNQILVQPNHRTGSPVDSHRTPVWLAVWWSPLDSSPVESSGVQWSLVESGGVHWSLLESGGVHWSPVDSGYLFI